MKLPNILDWRISLTAFVALIIAFALIWARVSTNWERGFLSVYESVDDYTPIMSGFFDVYVDEDRGWLIYVREECERDDTRPGFSLHLIPRDIDDLPESRKHSGFDNLDFEFAEHGLRFDNKCVIQVNLPDYDIIRIRTGLYAKVSDESDESDEFFPIWVQGASVTPISQKREFLSVYESVGDDTPIIRGFFDVYIDEGRGWLIYVREECERDDTQSRFLLHLTPRDINELPESRNQFRFDNLDFEFAEHGLRFGNKCVIQFDLPDYDIIRIRTGQYVQIGDEFSQVWTEETPIALTGQSEQ